MAFKKVSTYSKTVTKYFNLKYFFYQYSYYIMARNIYGNVNKNRKKISEIRFLYISIIALEGILYFLQGQNTHIDRFTKVMLL